MTGWDSYWAAQRADIKYREMRARLQAKITEQDRLRGRPLTDRERLANLRHELDRPLTIAKCDAEMVAAGIILPPAPMPFEPQPENSAPIRLKG